MVLPEADDGQVLSLFLFVYYRHFFLGFLGIIRIIFFKFLISFFA